MEYEKQYRMEIHTEDYRISLREFLEWMKIHTKEQAVFFAGIKEYLEEPSNNQLYYIAVDFSIPVIMVKWFIRYQ